jgi:hypothetical protein
MTLWEKIIDVYPELTDSDFGRFGTIELQDDSDGLGAFIAKWEYLKSLPSGMKIGK